MNKRTKIVTFTLAILLVGSIAYAAEKRKQSRPAAKSLDSIPEEALAAELLESTDERPVKTVDIADVSLPDADKGIIKVHVIADQTKE
ncbi:MAG: hypothetical protein CXR31_07940 [Geobacter sp.]|nr:MAG: hypothetical protein CXR31_07940 [Geobacter sp.]